MSFRLDQLSLALTSAASRAKLVRSRGAVVTVPAHNIWATLALTATGFTHCADGTLIITLAFWEIRQVGITVQ